MTWAVRTSQSREDWLIDLRALGLELDPISPPAQSLLDSIEPRVAKRREQVRVLPARSPPRSAKKKGTRKAPGRRKPAALSTPSKASTSTGTSASRTLARPLEGVPPAASRLPPRKKHGRGSPADKPKKSSVSVTMAAAEKSILADTHPEGKRAKQPRTETIQLLGSDMLEREGWLHKLKGGAWKRRYCELVSTSGDERFLVYRAKPGKRELWRIMLNGAVLQEGKPTTVAELPPISDGMDTPAHVWTVYDIAGDSYIFAAVDDATKTDWMNHRH